MFGLQDKDIDHWCYDMMGNSLLIRDGDGNYKFAHKSLVEFFVAYKFAAELGLLHKDFWGFMVGMGTEDAHTWSEYCEVLACSDAIRCLLIKEFAGFNRGTEEYLVRTFGKMLLTKIVINWVAILAGTHWLPLTLIKPKNLKITMGTLMGRFLFGDFGILFWFLDKPAPTMWILVWGL
jgi:predicted NACHT family NTPase